jgi:hypothetical protein
VIVPARTLILSNLEKRHKTLCLIAIPPKRLRIKVRISPRLIKRKVRLVRC